MFDQTEQNFEYMGQQQLLLVILVMILIGIATIIAINTMEQSHNTANEDAIRQKMIDASTLAQGYYYKNRMMGGGDGSFQEITLNDLNIEADGTLGAFSISEPGEDSFTLTAEPASDRPDIVSVIYKDRIEFVTDTEDED